MTARRMLAVMGGILLVAVSAGSTPRDVNALVIAIGVTVLARRRFPSGPEESSPVR